MMNWASLLKPWQINVYDFIENNHINMGNCNYNPLLFIFIKVQYFFAYIIGGGEAYKEWLNNNFLALPENYNIFRYTFATKSFVILVTFLTSFILKKLVFQQEKNKEKSQLASLLFLLNPITIYSTAIIGQNDIYGVFLFLIGWLLFQNHRFESLIIFGLSIATKNYPLFWVVILISLTHYKNIFYKLISYAIPILISFSTILPFIFSQAFRKNVIDSSISERMFISNISIGFDESILIVPILLIIIMFLALDISNKEVAIKDKSIFLFTTTLVILAFMHFHVHWFLWIIPFRSIFIVSQQKINPNNLIISTLILISWIIVLLLFDDQTLYFGLLSPINFNLLSYPSIPFILKHFKINYELYDNLAHSFLAGIALWYVCLCDKISNKKVTNYE